MTGPFGNIHADQRARAVVYCFIMLDVISKGFKMTDVRLVSLPAHKREDPQTR